jgi:hypothetical protein
MTPSDEPAQTIPSSYGLAAVDPPIPMLILERDFRIRWISRAAIRELRLQPDFATASHCMIEISISSGGNRNSA